MDLIIGVGTHTEEQRAAVDAFNVQVKTQAAALRDAESIAEILAAEAESLSFSKLRKKVEESNAHVHALLQESVLFAIQREELLRRLEAEFVAALEAAENALAAEREKVTQGLRDCGLGAHPNSLHPDSDEQKLLVQVNSSHTVRQAVERVRQAGVVLRQCRTALEHSDAVILSKRKELRDVTVQMLLKV